MTEAAYNEFLARALATVPRMHVPWAGGATACASSATLSGGSSRVWQNLNLDPAWRKERDRFWSKPDNNRGRKPLVEPDDLLIKHTNCRFAARIFAELGLKAFQFDPTGVARTDEAFVASVNALFAAAVLYTPYDYEQYGRKLSESGSVKKYYELFEFGNWLLNPAGASPRRRRGKAIDATEVLRLTAAMFAALELKRRAERRRREKQACSDSKALDKSATDPRSSGGKPKRPPPLPTRIARTELRNAWAILFGTYPPPDTLKNRVPAAQARCRDFLEWWAARHPGTHVNGSARCKGLERIADEYLFEASPPPKRKRRAPTEN